MAVMEGDPRQGAKLPLFGGSTGGLLSAAETEEKYVITWTGKPGQVFEMPTGGAAEMVEGKNFLTFARKEQCLALGAQLRSDYKINDYQIFRIPAGGGACVGASQRRRLSREGQRRPRAHRQSGSQHRQKQGADYLQVHRRETLGLNSPQLRSLLGFRIP